MRIHTFWLSCCLLTTLTPVSDLLHALEHGAHQSVYRTFCQHASADERFFFYSCIKEVLQITMRCQAYQCAVTVLTVWYQRRTQRQKRKRVLVILFGLSFAFGGAVWWGQSTQKNTAHKIVRNEGLAKRPMLHALDIFPTVGPDERAQRRKPPGLGPAVSFIRRHASTIGGTLRAAAHAGVVYAALRPRERECHDQRPLVRAPSFVAPVDMQEPSSGLPTGVVVAGGLAAGAVGGYLLARQQQKEQSRSNFLPGPGKK